MLTATYRESLANAQKNDDALAFTRTELAKCEETFKALQLETFNLQAKIETVTSMAADITANDARQEQQLASIDKDYDSAESMAQKLCEEAAECRVKGEEAQNQIARLMEEQETVKIQADEASDEITAARIEKNKWDSDRENLEQMLARVIGAAEDFDFQLSAKNAEADSLKQEKNKIMFGSGDAEETVKTKTDEKVSLEEYIGRVSEERTALAVQLEEMSIRQGAAADKFNACRDQKYQEEIKLAKNETQLDTLKEKLWDEFEISYLQAVEFRKEDFAMSTAQKESREIKSRLKELGDVNVGAIEEYAQVRERYEFLTEQRGDITSAMQQLKAIIDDMEKTIKTKFKENFDKVVINFEAIFKSLFGGGHAELRLDDEDNPLEAGIEIIAQPPGKKLQNINLMSGGEKDHDGYSSDVCGTQDDTYAVLYIGRGGSRARRQQYREVRKIFKELQRNPICNSNASKGDDGARRRALRSDYAGTGYFQGAFAQIGRRFQFIIQKFERGQYVIIFRKKVLLRKTFRKDNRRYNGASTC